MNYKIVNGNSVVESRTGHVMVEGVSQEEARKIARRMNMGGAFDGWTPEFFFNKLKVDLLS